jgi:antirestriction protein ArdC
MNRDLSGASGSENCAYGSARRNGNGLRVQCERVTTNNANHPAYIATRLKKLKSDKHEIFRRGPTPGAADGTLATILNMRPKPACVILYYR